MHRSRILIAVLAFVLLAILAALALLLRSAPGLPPPAQPRPAGSPAVAALASRAAAPELTRTRTPNPGPTRRLANGQAARGMDLPLPPERCVITGFLLDAASGLPIPGARVGLIDDPGSFAEAGTDGAYRLPSPRPGLVSLRAAAPGHQARSTTIAACGAAVDFRLPPAPRLRGLVLESRSRSPIEGARLSLRPEQSPASTPLSAGVSDAEGRFDLELPGAGLVAWLEAEADGYATRQLPLRLAAPPAQPGQVLMLLEPGARIAGRVLDPGGRPIAGAKLRLAHDMLFHGMSETSSAADGTYSFDGATGGLDYYIVAWHEAYLPATDYLWLPAKGLMQAQDMTLRPAGGIEGLVVSASGEAVQSVLVKAVGLKLEAMELGASPVLTDRLWPREARSDEDGAFLLGALRPGLYELQALGAAGAVAAKAELEVRAGEVLRGVTLNVGDSLIEGRVLGPDGEPLAGARVLAFTEKKGKPAPDPRQAKNAVTTDAGGGFSVGPLEPGEVSLKAVLGIWSATAGPLQAPAAGVELRMPPQTTLSGHVHDAGTGLPIEEFSLGLASASDSAGTPFLPFASPQGAFTLEASLTGAGKLRVRAPGYLEAELSLPESGAARDLRVELLPTGRLQGRVVDGQGSPVGGAQISVERGLAPGCSTSSIREERPIQFTDERGVFQLDCLASSAIELEVEAPGFVRGLFQVSASEAEPRPLRLERGVRLRGKVLDARTKQPLPGVLVEIYAQQLTTMTDPAGRFEFTEAARGPITIKALPQGVAEDRGGRLTLDVDSDRDDLMIEVER